MTSLLYAGGEEPPHISRGLSGIFRRKSRGGAHSLFEAEQEADALDEFHVTTAVAAGPPARQDSKSAGPWGVLTRKSSLGQRAGGGPAAAEARQPAAAEAQQQQEELQFFKAEYLRQGQELQELRDEAQQATARQAQEQLNMQRFKYELLLDLWGMRVLDNEELGSQG